MLACLLVGLGVGRFFPGGTIPLRNAPVVDVNRAEDVDGSGVAVNSADVPQVAVDASPVFAASKIQFPALYQVEDNPTESVFYTDYSVPQFLLDALVLSGHDVQLDQEFLGYTESMNDPRAVPVNVLRIKKYGQLLAALDSPALRD